MSLTLALQPPAADVSEAVDRIVSEHNAARDVKGRPMKFLPLIAKEFKENPYITPTEVTNRVGCALSTSVLNLRRLRQQVATRKYNRQVGPIYGVTLQGATLKHLAFKTSDHLDALIDRVKGGVDVISAAEFVRWLSLSGVIEICIPEDGVKLRPKLAKLSCMCNDYFRARGTSIETEDQQIPQVNKKLDVILAILAKA